MMFMRHCHWMAGVALGALTFACLAQAPSKKGTSDVKKQAYGKLPDGAPIELYTLSNPNGMRGGHHDLWRNRRLADGSRP